MYGKNKSVQAQEPLMIEMVDCHFRTWHYEKEPVEYTFCTKSIVYYQFRCREL